MPPDLATTAERAQSMRSLVRGVKNKQFDEVEILVREATSNSKDNASPAVVEKILKASLDAFQYTKLFNMLWKRITDVDYPRHVLKGLVLVDYLVRVNPPSPSVQEKLVRDLVQGPRAFFLSSLAAGLMVAKKEPEVARLAQRLDEHVRALAEANSKKKKVRRSQSLLVGGNLGGGGHLSPPDMPNFRRKPLGLAETPQSSSAVLRSPTSAASSPSPASPVGSSVGSSVGSPGQAGQGAGKWGCTVCTYANKQRRFRCKMCQTPRPGGSSIASSTAPVAGGVARGKGGEMSGAKVAWSCSACGSDRSPPEAIRCTTCSCYRDGHRPARGVAANGARAGRSVSSPEGGGAALAWVRRKAAAERAARGKGEGSLDGESRRKASSEFDAMTDLLAMAERGGLGSVGLVEEEEEEAVGALSDSSNAEGPEGPEVAMGPGGDKGPPVAGRAGRGAWLCPGCDYTNPDSLSCFCGMCGDRRQAEALPQPASHSTPVTSQTQPQLRQLQPQPKPSTPAPAPASAPTPALGVQGGGSGARRGSVNMSLMSRMAVLQQRPAQPHFDNPYAELPSPSVVAEAAPAPAPAAAAAAAVAGDSVVPARRAASRQTRQRLALVEEAAEGGEGRGRPPGLSRATSGASGASAGADWPCGYCTFLNRAKRKKCEICRERRKPPNAAMATSSAAPTAAAAASASSSTRASGGGASHKKQKWHVWTCDYCSFGNAMSATICGVCSRDPPASASAAIRAAQPAAKPTAAAAVPAPATASGPPATRAAVVGSQAAGWECEACTFHNDDASAGKCSMCASRRPTAAAAAAAAAATAAAQPGISSARGGATGSWVCAFCTFENTSDARACMLCMARRNPSSMMQAALQTHTQQTQLLQRAANKAGVAGGAVQQDDDPYAPIEPIKSRKKPSLPSPAASPLLPQPPTINRHLDPFTLQADASPPPLTTPSPQPPPPAYTPTRSSDSSSSALATALQLGPPALPPPSYASFLDFIPPPPPPLLPSLEEGEEEEEEEEEEERVEERERRVVDHSAAAVESRQRKRVESIREVISTERSYVEALTELISHYIQPINSKSKKFGLSSSQITAMFSNVSVLSRFHQVFLGELERASRDLGPVFVKFADFLRMYTSYINDYERTATTINSMRQNKRFQSFLAEQMEQHGGRSLMSYLIRPVQRIPQYVILLKELIKNTEEGHPQLPILREALRKVETIASHINENKRYVENLTKLLDVQNRIKSTDLKIVQPHRRFIREGVLTMHFFQSNRIKPYRFFLFNTLLLRVGEESYALKERTNRLGECTVGEAPDQHPLKFMVSFPEDKRGEATWVHWVLEAKVTADKEQWMQAFRALNGEDSQQARDSAQSAAKLARQREADVAMLLRSHARQKERSARANSMFIASSPNGRGLLPPSFAASLMPPSPQGMNSPSSAASSPSHSPVAPQSSHSLLPPPSLLPPAPALSSEATPDANSSSNSSSSGGGSGSAVETAAGPADLFAPRGGRARNRSPRLSLMQARNKGISLKIHKQPHAPAPSPAPPEEAKQAEGAAEMKTSQDSASAEAGGSMGKPPPPLMSHVGQRGSLLVGKPPPILSKSKPNSNSSSSSGGGGSSSSSSSVRGGSDGADPAAAATAAPQSRAPPPRAKHTRAASAFDVRSSDRRGSAAAFGGGGRIYSAISSLADGAIPSDGRGFIDSSVDPFSNAQNPE